MTAMKECDRLMNEPRRMNTSFDLQTDLLNSKIDRTRSHRLVQKSTEHKKLFNSVEIFFSRSFASCSKDRSKLDLSKTAPEAPRPMRIYYTRFPVAQ